MNEYLHGFAWTGRAQEFVSVSQKHPQWLDPQQFPVSDKEKIIIQCIYNYKTDQYIKNFHGTRLECLLTIMEASIFWALPWSRLGGRVPPCWNE